MDNSNIWKVIDSYFSNNPQCLVQHHIESYDDFFKNGIYQIFKDKNPITINGDFDEEINDYKTQCIMYFGGKDGKKVYFGKPVIYDDFNSHYMFPNEARLRNMTYGMTIHYDVEIDFVNNLKDGETPEIVGGEDLLDNSDDEETKQLISYKNGGSMEQPEIEDLNKFKQDWGITGGAPRKTTKQKKTISSEKMTPAQQRLIMELTEKSLKTPKKQVITHTLEKIYLGKFPIMVQSNFCILRGLSPDVRHTMGECRNDIGGYFIIDGKEKVVIPQEKFGDNMLYIRNVNDEHFLYSAEIRSVSENVSKPIRTLSVKIVTPSKLYTNKNIVVNIPNVKKPVPLFIVFRALGIISDKRIIEMCLLDMKKYEDMIDLFIPSVHDASSILTQREALKYIALLTKYKTITYAQEILCDYFLPHLGETNYIKKAYYLGHIVYKLLCAYTGLEKATDRDSYNYKRVELVGSLMTDLFREYYTQQLRAIEKLYESKLYYNKNLYSENLKGLITHFQSEFFGSKTRLVEVGFKKAFKGNWGATEHTKRVGVVQDLNRLSFLSYISHMRKTNLDIGTGAKLVGPRVLHGSQWGLYDPIDTPDGGNIGLHKHLSISSYITRGISKEPIIQWLREKMAMRVVEDYLPQNLANMTKVFVNGDWVGSIINPIENVQKFKLFRRNGLIPIYISINFEIKTNTIYIYTDAGRICRPLFYKDEFTNKMAFSNEKIIEKISKNNFIWNELVTGFNEKKIDDYSTQTMIIYELDELYKDVTSETNPAKIERFLKEKSIIEYIDTNEVEGALIALDYEDIEKYKDKKYTHLEIHHSFILGTMGNVIPFPENNPATRNSFSCGQSKQACSLYHTNFQNRMDKTAVVLNSGQIPIVKSRYLEHINNEENSYGENVIVAIMIYTGYNVEDAILINEGSLKRGMFRTTYYTTYEAHEESSKNANTETDKTFINVENETGLHRMKIGYDYSKLDKYGIIKENTEVNDKVILIGMSENTKSEKIDISKTTKKGQLGIVDKTYITEGEEGARIAKVRIREERIPNLGDKFGSRHGQKGTVGLVIPESDMPFTKDGIRPDIIVNPHAIPSRMTIGQLVEMIVAKTCVLYGGFGDATAFNNKGPKVLNYGELLVKAGEKMDWTNISDSLGRNMGFHSTGQEYLYNGMTGEQIESKIFIGPTYYMRLKHMVKDKINYRALGPNAKLTRQPVGGRANDGGLRIGEMERDTVISHGATNFLKESMMERADKYHIAICNLTGMIAIYNPSKNIFMSPMADGPIKFTGSLDGKEQYIQNITQFGRDFSVVSVPYSFKLLIQELQAINIQLRIITEDNIQQLENMSFSKNIDKLMIHSIDKFNDSKDKVSLVINNIRDTLQKSVNTSFKKHSDMFDYLNNAEEENKQSEFRILEETVISPSSIKVTANELESIPGWKEEYSEKFNRKYWFNEKTGETSWERPDIMPGWRQIYSETYKRNYWFNDSTGETSWEAPLKKIGGEVDKEFPSYEDELLGDKFGGTIDDRSPLSKYEVGEKVYLGGDKINREWTIERIGDKFLTIVTDSVNDFEDSMKVVRPMDIVKIEKLPQPKIYGGLDNSRQIILPNEYLANQHVMPPMAYPNITINPVMKMIQGDDKSTEIVDKKIVEPTVTTNTDSIDTERIVEQVGSLPDIIIKQKTDSVIEDIMPKEIDFSKGSFLVKKTE